MAITLDGTNGVTTPDLTVDTTTITVDPSNNRVGIGTASPTVPLQVAGDIKESVSGANAQISAITDGASNYATFTTTNGSRSYSMQIRPDQSNAFAVRDETGGGNRLLINTSGHVTTPSQPRFHAYRASSAFTGGISGNEIFPFDNTTLNVGNHFNTSTYRFTAPVAGTYFFGCHLRSAISGETRVVRIMLRKNGTQQWDLASIGGGASPNISGGDHMGIEGSTIINAAANDYFDLQFSTELSISGTMYFDGGTRTNFYGFLIA